MTPLQLVAAIARLDAAFERRMTKLTREHLTHSGLRAAYSYRLHSILRSTHEAQK